MPAKPTTKTRKPSRSRGSSTPRGDVDRRCRRPGPTGLRSAVRSSRSGASPRAARGWPGGARSARSLRRGQGAGAVWRGRAGSGGGPASGSSWRPAVAVAGLAAICAAIVIGVVGTGGGSSGPSIPAAARLAFAPSVGRRAGRPERHAARRLLRRRDVSELREVLGPADRHADRPDRRPPGPDRVLPPAERHPAQLHGVLRQGRPAAAARASCASRAFRCTSSRRRPGCRWSRSSATAAHACSRRGQADVVLGLAAAPVLEQAHA